MSGRSTWLRVGAVVSPIRFVGLAAAITLTPAAAGAQGVDPPVMQAWPQPDSAAGGLGPMRLTRPLATASLARLQADAESAFAQRNYRDAYEAYRQLVDLEPGNTRAWFRLGNLYQRGSDLGAAGDAYRKVLELATGHGEDSVWRAKSLMNLALLGLWRARLALAELDRQYQDPTLADERGQLERDLADSESRLAALGRRVAAPDPRPNRSAAGGPVAAPVDSRIAADRVSRGRGFERQDRAPVERELPPLNWRSSGVVQHIQGMPGRGSVEVPVIDASTTARGSVSGASVAVSGKPKDD